MQIDRSIPQYFISTEEDRNTPWRQVSSGTRMVHQQRYMPGGENKLEQDYKLASTISLVREKIGYWAIRSFRVTNPHQLRSPTPNHAILFIEML